MSTARIGVGRQIGGPLALAAAAAALAVCWPREGVAVAALIWGVVLIWSLPREWSVGLPLLVLLLIPADHISGLNGPAHGFFVLGATAILAISASIRAGSDRVHVEDWDFALLIVVLCGATLAHAASGELRGILFWVGAGLFLHWLRTEERRAGHAVDQVAYAIMLAGAAGGLVAILNHVGVFDAASALPGYKPSQLDFNYEIGLRAAGLSGHPLRFGSLTMLASLFAVAWLVDGNLPKERRPILIGVLALSLVGLALSGARGSWLGLGVAMGALALSHLDAGSRKRVLRLIGYACAAGFLVWVTGLWTLIHARIFGTASHPGSINQRLQVVNGIAYIWSRVPPFGVGFGGAAEMAMRMGLRFFNLENEFLRFFFTAGFAGPVALLLLGFRRMGAAARGVPSPHRTAGLCGIAAILVNVATYNMFSWSMGPPILAALCLLAMPSNRPRLVS